MADPQLDRIEQALAAQTVILRRLDLQNQQQTAQLISLNLGVQLMANATAQQLTDMAAQIDAATNTISGSISTISTKLDAEQQNITAVATLVQTLRDQLTALGVPQAVIDQLTGVVTKLGTSAAAIDAATTTLDTHTAQLAGIAADPSNPVPVPVA